MFALISGSGFLIVSPAAGWVCKFEDETAWVVGPLAVVAMAVLYYDLRTRNEGLDVEQLVARLQATTPSAASGPPSAVLPG